MANYVETNPKPDERGNILVNYSANVTTDNTFQCDNPSKNVAVTCITYSNTKKFVCNKHAF